MNTRLGITQPPVAACAGHLIQITNKTKLQTQSSADRITTSLNLAHKRKVKQTNKQKTSAQTSPYMKFPQNTGLTLGGSEVAQSCPTLCDPTDYIAYQAPPSMGFSRQEYWSGLRFPSPGHLPYPGIELWSPTLWADTLSSKPPGKPGT